MAWLSRLLIVLAVAARRAERHEQPAVFEGHGRSGREARPLAGRDLARMAGHEPALRSPRRHDAADPRHHRRVHVRIAGRGGEAIALRVDDRDVGRVERPGRPRGAERTRHHRPAPQRGHGVGVPRRRHAWPRAILADEGAPHIGIGFREQRVSGHLDVLGVTVVGPRGRQKRFSSPRPGGAAPAASCGRVM